MGGVGSVVQSVVGRVRFGLIDLIRRTSTVSILHELEAIQFESPPQLQQRQQALLQGYVDLVRKASPLYARLTGFAQFPVIDKAFANANRAGLVNPGYRGKVVSKKTGGSTGEPFVYATGVKAQSYLWAAILLSWRVAGYRLGEPVAFIAGTALFGTGYKQKIYYALMNVHMYSAFDMSAARLEAYAADIARQRCRLVYGYASAIHQLALHINKSGRRPPFRLRGVVCTAEVLTPAMRETIEQAFGVPCFSQYGCNDAGVSAYECERRSGFHLITQRSYFEVLPGGRLVSTDMANDAFFLPRYDTGDLVEMAAAPCPCGRGFPLIKNVVGRANDLVEDSAGNTVHSEFFTHLFREDRRISEFQVVYDARELVIIVHCADAAFAHPPYLERIAAALAFATIRFAVNQPFVAIKNGKHRFVMRVDNVEQALGETLAC
ncbi:hypothetical protein PO883_19635 [Massilia sp. DJPM01]|uniref:hypothetical protein n=1 Tax=Massilia sp. DJPM01 TaxID=3024404 RepID=UPI00259D9B1F|nr:hypothetical protein [Massilia sp. DJPM01]MDM5179406.1 hypothetical protein [Massilia sp. DJPM01]